MKLNAVLDQLIELLNQETELYRSMQGFIDREKDAAMRSDLEALTEAGVEKEKILVELRRKDENRRQLVAGLAGKLKYPVQDLTLTKISQMVAEPQAGRLRRVSKEFIAVLSQLQASNQQNKHLFEHSLELLRGSFNLLGELLTPGTVYYRTGNIQSTKSTGKCVCSEI